MRIGPFQGDKINLGNLGGESGVKTAKKDTESRRSITPLVIRMRIVVVLIRHRKVFFSCSFPLALGLQKKITVKTEILSGRFWGYKKWL